MPNCKVTNQNRRPKILMILIGRTTVTTWTMIFRCRFDWWLVCCTQAFTNQQFSPPHTEITCPLMYAPMSEARKMQVFATSSPEPRRFIGIEFK